MMKLCAKCGIEKDKSNFYHHGKTCIPCQKTKNYDYSCKVKIEGKIRKCLMCDGEFVSFGNRKCESCNSMSYDESNSVSNYLSVG